MDKLLSVLLKLSAESKGFSRMYLMLFDSERQVAYGAHTTGVPEEVDRTARDIEIPIQEDSGILAELLLHRRPTLVSDIASVADRMHPVHHTLARQVGVTSFVCAPLISRQRTLGFVGADKGAQPCTQEDLVVLTTIAFDMAGALDHVLAYRQLEQHATALEKEVRERTQELGDVSARLHELDRLKATFVSSVSHELRTPITSIKGYVENMLEGLAGKVTDKQANYLHRVQHNADRLTRLINDLLDLSRIEAGRVELQKIPISIDQLVQDVVEGFLPLAQEKSISLASLRSGLLPLVQADREKVRQILNNLIQNAIKFSSERGQIQIQSLTLPEGFVQVCVSDTGCGIPSYELDKVFERFYRGGAATGEAQGAGLGLAIAKSLVELHGGKIWATSAPGKGSRFFFTLPVGP